MALFNFGKKKEEENTSPCCCDAEQRTEKIPSCCCDAETKAEESVSCCCGSDSKAEEASSCCCGEKSDGIRSVKVLGAGCKSCHEQYESAKEAARALGLHVEVEYVTDMQKVMEYGVMSMPAIVVNEKVVSMGKVLKAADVEKLLLEMR